MKIELINEARFTGKMITGTEEIKEFKLTDVPFGDRTLTLNVLFMLSDRSGSNVLDIIYDIPLEYDKEPYYIVTDFKRDILMSCFKFNHSDTNSLIYSFNTDDMLKQCSKYMLSGCYGERNKVIWNTILDSYYLWVTLGVYEH